MAKKTKYAPERTKQSKAFAAGMVTTQVYTGDPSINVRVAGNYPLEVLYDLQNAVDEVLKHHNF